MSISDRFTDNELLLEANKYKSAKQFYTAIGLKSGASYTKYLLPRLKALGFSFPDARITYTNQILQEASQNATSISDVARNLGILPNGRAHAHIKQAIKRYGIEIKPGHRKHTRIRLLEEYLVVAGPRINTSRLRKRLIAAGMKSNHCEECRLGPEWNDKPLVLQLDHIDGDHSNCTLLNLRILCPNCHSQTPTYARQKDHCSTN